MLNVFLVEKLIKGAQCATPLDFQLHVRESEFQKLWLFQPVETEEIARCLSALFMRRMLKLVPKKRRRSKEFCTLQYTVRFLVVI